MLALKKGLSAGSPIEGTMCPAQEPLNSPREHMAHTSSEERSEGSSHAGFEVAIEADGPTSAAGKHASWMVLTAYTLFLGYRALRHSQAGGEENMPVWQLQDSSRIFALIGGIALAALYQFAYFVPVGFFSAMVVCRAPERLRRFPAGLAALMVAGILAVSVYAVASGRSWHPAEIVGLTIALLGCMFGTWVGTVWLRGWAARLWLLPKTALLAFSAALCCGAVLWLLVERTPLPFEPPQVTSADKRELVQLARSQRPRSVKAGQTQTLQLTQRHINLLLAWGLSLHSKDRKAKVDLERHRVSLWSSFGMPVGRDRTYYFNLVAEGSPEIRQGDIRLNVDRCRIGSVPVPHWLLDMFSPVISSLLSHDPRSRPFIEATRELMIGPDLVEVTYSRLRLPSEFREAVFGPSTASEEVLAAVRAQVEHLLSAVAQSADTQMSFGFCVENAFSLARTRSVQRNAVTENRGAIFALGILLGHPRVEEFLGPVFDDRDNSYARRLLRSVRLRGRSDWTRHFFVSAAIALLSDEIVSNAAGLLKEELDADTGGSGFSFADLLADRAGTTLAISATCDEASARALQDRIASGFQVDDFFPPAADLPEGISDAQLQAQYGGVGGEAYGQLIEEIERRISSCSAYR